MILFDFYSFDGAAIGSTSAQDFPEAVRSFFDVKGFSCVGVEDTDNVSHAWSVTIDGSDVPRYAVQRRGEQALPHYQPPADRRPGFYYVSIKRENGEARFLRGPFTLHKDALDALPAAREAAERVDPRACWYAFGTARSATDAGPGILDQIEKRAQS